MGILDTAFIDAEGEPLGVTDTCFIPLELGWNLIGAPFYSSIELKDVKVKKGSWTGSMWQAVLMGWVQDILYTYTAGYNGYTSESVLMPWRGYWFNALKTGCTLLVTQAGTKSLKMLATEDETPTLENWRLLLEARNEGATDNISIGVSEDATNEFDNKYDYFEPPIPPIDNWIQAYFERTEWECEFSEKFNQDIKAPIETEGTKSWTFDISPSTNGNITLSWPGITELPENLSLTLVDLASGNQVNMREQDSYQYTTDGTNHFRIDVKAGSEGSDRPSYPFALYQNKPNPFVGRTTISYSVAKKCKVELNLYDLSGRLVKNLIDKEVKYGRYTTAIESKNFASGIYFLKFKAGDYKSTKKIITIR